MSGKPTVEILVHTTAPSRATDDVNYRHLAAAYLDFEPNPTTELGALRLANEGRRDGCEQERHEPRAGNDVLRGIPAFNQSYGLNSSNISFASADHNLISPELRRTQGHAQADVTESQSSWRAPPSVIADSNPDNNISIAQYCSPTRILEHYLQGVESSQSSSSQPIPFGPYPTSSPTATCRQATIPQSQTPVLPLVRQLPSPSTSDLSVIPQSPLFTGRKRTRQELPTSALKQTVIAPSIVVPEPGSSPPRAYQPDIEVKIPSIANDSRNARSLSLSAADCIPSSKPESETAPQFKRQRQLLTETKGSSLSRSSSDIGPHQDYTKRTLSSQRPTSTPFSNALEIRSPEPAVSCAELSISGIVTPRLEKLAKDVKLEKRFEQRKKQTRELRPFERGYWLVDCSTWPEEAKQMAWGFLGNYVGNGLAGWGIWCRRDEDFQTLRLYCWGCVAGYMFLVLWLSSQRELNYVESTWIAGDGQTVITIDAKYKRP